uniref:Uncharacterized protein n=2 Tax=Dunaliella tertiolecta TaxID=3047 RepID=A0A7S3VV98_DUNTE
MLNPGTKPKDFDFFLVVPTVRGHPSENTAEAERRNAAQRLVTTLVKALDESLHDACPSDDGLHLRTLSFHRFASHVIDVMAVRHPAKRYSQSELFETVIKEQETVFSGQIILRLYESPAQVVHGFDVDACRLLYDGRDVWATEAALRAWHCRFMLVEPLRQSPSYEHRLLKYSKRYGLRILVPGLHPDLITVVCNRCNQGIEQARKHLQRSSSPYTCFWGIQDFPVRHHKSTSIKDLRTVMNFRGSGLLRLLETCWIESWAAPIKEDAGDLAKEAAFWKELGRMQSVRSLLFSEFSSTSKKGLRSLLGDELFNMLPESWADIKLLCMAETSAQKSNNISDYCNEESLALPFWFFDKLKSVAGPRRTLPFITKNAHLQKGQDASCWRGEVFLGSFKAMPMHDWYLDALRQLVEVGSPALGAVERAKLTEGLTEGLRDWAPFKQGRRRST